VSLKIRVFFSSVVRTTNQFLIFFWGGGRWGVQILVVVTVFSKYLNFAIVSKDFIYISGTILVYVSTNRLGFLIRGLEF